MRILISKAFISLATTLSIGIFVFCTKTYAINPTINTLNATNIGTNSATLNSSWDAGYASEVFVMFKYGTTIDMTNSTDNVSYTTYSGTHSVNLTDLLPGTTYYFRAQIAGNGFGFGQMMSFTTDNIQNLCNIDYFYASPDEIEEGDNTTIHFGTTNCYSVYLSGNGISGYYNLNDSVNTGNLWNNTTFTLTATGNGESDYEIIEVEVYDNNNDDECEIDEFNVSPSFVEYGGYVNISWETSDCDDVEIIGGNINNNYGNDGQISAGPIYNNTIFYIYADGDNGNDNDHDSVTISNNSYYNNNNYYNYVCSDGIDNDGDGYTDMSDAGCTSISDSDEYNYVYASYTPPQTFYYQQSSTNTTKNVIKKITNTGGGKTNLSLIVETRKKDICQSDIYQGVVTYKNNSTYNLKNVVIRILLPKNISYRNSSSGIYTSSDNTITININKINKGEEGVVYISGDVKNSIVKEGLVITEAQASFTNTKNGLTENAIAYSVQESTSCRNALSGFALGTGFLPQTLIGWLIFIIAVTILLIIVREFYGHKNYQKKHINLT